VNETPRSTWPKPAVRSVWKLSPAAGIGGHLDDPRMRSALTRLFTSIEPAIAKLEAFGRQRPAA
jgi:hypothetical protein